MKKYLIPESGNFYKANLHCHSTVSDGSLSPEELKKIYMEKGYSIIAYTDHDVMIPHFDLQEENFLPLTGFEMEFTEHNKPDWSRAKTSHLCFIALSPEQRKQPNKPHDGYLFGNAKNYMDKLEFYDEPVFYRNHTAENINKAIKNAKEKGFFVTYNHPVWSLDNREDYLGYEGMDAMEICNFGCVVMGYNDYVPQIYDEMLMSGKRIFCLATDDNHNHQPAGTRKFDSFGGFTMIKAEKLKYEAITKALTDGHFYASQGPTINSLWFEQGKEMGKIHVSCSPADRVYINTGRRRAVCEYAENGNPLTEVSFRVDPKEGYVRITVIDEKGYPANTNAYFVDELFE